jgi:hypothetical protein
MVLPGVRTDSPAMLNRSIVLRVTLILVVQGTVSCADQTGSDASGRIEAQVDTVNGVLHVWNSPEGAWTDGEQWTVEELLRLGARAAPEEELFSGPLLTGKLGPDGFIYVLDSDAEQITVFSSDGAFVRHIGRPGRGPGEFVGPSAMSWDGLGRLWVADGFGGRYTLFSTAGDFIRTQSRPVHALARRQHPLIYTSDGAFLDEAAASSAVSFLRVDTGGARVDTLGTISRPEMTAAVRSIIRRPGSDFQTVSRRYIRRSRWAVTSDSTIWSADTGELKLVHRKLSGDTIRVVHTTHRSQQFSSAEADLIDRGLAEVGLQRHEIDLVRPIVQQIVVLDDGHVLVQIEMDVGDDGTIFDVFDPDGRYLGPLDFGFAPTRLGGTSFRGDTVVVTTVGRLDVPYVVKAVIRRPGTASDG